MIFTFVKVFFNDVNSSNAISLIVQRFPLKNQVTFLLYIHQKPDGKGFFFSIFPLSIMYEKRLRIQPSQSLVKLQIDNDF